MPDAEALLADLDDEQRAAVLALHGPVCILAGAGTGKTRTITRRIAYGVATGVYRPDRVMALTFTARAAGELRTRLHELGAPVQSRTFHATALAQLNHFWPLVVGGGFPTVVTTKARLLGQAAERLRIKADTATLRDVAAEIEWRKVSRLSIEQYGTEVMTQRKVPGTLTAEQLIDLHRGYETAKDEQRSIDFEDVLLAAAGMIESEPRVANQVREQYRFFVVDEYQDVSPLQQELLDLWLGERNDLCVVGDASQTIYSFAGASSRFLLDFSTRYRGAQSVRLEHNFRSAAPVLAAANALMRGQAGALSLVAAPDAVRPEDSAAPAVTISGHASDVSEAHEVARSVAQEIAAGRRPEQIAILFRINAQAQLLESALDAAGVPSQVRGMQRFFELREVQDAMLLLRGAALSITDEPLFKTVSDVLRGLGWSQNPPDARGALRDRWESLNAIMALAEEVPGQSLRGFVDELFRRKAGQHAPTMSAVTLASLHSAKGLEWESVHIVGLSEGLLPISFAVTAEQIDEERRLLYVGVTRARRALSLSWSGSIQRSPRKPSRFLAELTPTTAR